MEFIHVGQQLFRLDGIYRAVWRGQKLVVVFGDGYTTIEGDLAREVWNELIERSERIVEPPSPVGS